MESMSLYYPSTLLPLQHAPPTPSPWCQRYCYLSSFHKYRGEVRSSLLQAVKLFRSILTEVYSSVSMIE
ncbi:hypothetical protein DID88_008015 [Monilinia fructigena]|uniref:Uncharacterized protein n=1 Tax=Monilinia fructigena TaxID=38457 RepID=A0A395J518_9HELO|nr:hypothetical protein DID88_008015 [Monilinia fructigena]